MRDVDAGLSRAIGAPVVSEADLAPLPDPVRRYLRVTRALEFTMLDVVANNTGSR